MSIPVLICDDSALARKQMARALPAGWDTDVRFAGNGEEALEMIRQGLGHVLFLDLNMPGMSGLEVLDVIRKEDLPTSVLVVSGDVQSSVRQQVTRKGALDFISKPLDPEKLLTTLRRFGLIDKLSSNPANPDIDTRLPQEINFHEAFREVINVAMGQAGGRLGQTLNSFIGMPVPIIHDCLYGELAVNLECGSHTRLNAVSQGFGSLGVAGEALLLMSEVDLEKTEPANSYPESATDVPVGKLIDLCSLLAGSCLIGISEQLDLQFNHTSPALLGRNQPLADLLGEQARNRRVLAVEITYSLINQSACHLVLLFTGDSIPVLQDRTMMLDETITPVGV